MADRPHGLPPLIWTPELLDEIDAHAGPCRVTGAEPGPDMVLISDLTAEVRRLQRLHEKWCAFQDQLVRVLRSLGIEGKVMGRLRNGGHRVQCQHAAALDEARARIAQLEAEARAQTGQLCSVIRERDAARGGPA